MTVLVVVLGIVAVAALVATVLSRSRFQAQRRLAAAAEERSARQAADLAAAATALEAADRERAAAQERATAAEEGTVHAETQVIEATDLAREAVAQAREASARAQEAADARDEARRNADEAAAARQALDERVAAFERLAAEADESAAAAASARRRAPTVGGALDPQLLWALEQARSERTWRHSVAIGPDSVSVFTESSDPLLEALQVELDAAREEVGAVVELDAHLPDEITAAGSVLTLRAAQELLAEVIRRSESTTLRVTTDGADVVVIVDSVDEEGQRVRPGPLPLPSSSAIETIEGGVRIRAAVAPLAAG